MKKSAFPIYVTGGPESGYHPGMTLREYYAGQALAGWAANERNTGRFNPKDDAQWIVAVTNALIAELEGGE